MSSVFDGLADIFQGALAEDWVVMPEAGGTLHITGIFTDRPVIDIGIDTSKPEVSFTSIDAANLGEGDAAIRVGTGKTYKLRTGRPDGRGTTRFYLEECVT